MKSAEQIDIVVCMGSSCFARGNKNNLEYLENLAETGKLNIKLELSGNRCEKKCAEGPNIVINNKMYSNVTRDDLKKILSKFLT